MLNYLSAVRQRAEELAQKSADKRTHDPGIQSPEENRRLIHELKVHQIELEMQNEELRRTQLELEVSQARYFDLYELAPVGYFTLSEKGLILEANLTAAALLGEPRGAFANRLLSSIVVREDQDKYYRYLTLLIHTSPPPSCEIRLVRKDKSQIWVALATTLVQAADGGVTYRVVMSDISGRRQAEAYREMGRKILQILNEPGELQDSIQRVLVVLRTQTGSDAVGIRLQDGEDFPYFAQQGFSKEFLLTENSLLARAPDGGLCRNQDGTACLECACGLVLSGHADPANPLFTAGGSCWTNDSFQPHGIPPCAAPRDQPRNQCVHHGYASVALVPIRNGNGIVGLIQLNDWRKGFYALDTIELLEGIAAHIGMALLRKQLEALTSQALRAKETFIMEIHHRVKNNLQFISSLVSLQAAGLADAGLREVLGDVGDRIRAIALIHEELYQADRVGQVNFADYAASLLNHIWHTHGTPDGRVRLALQISPMVLPIETAVTCGLILNELAGNALKHAFPSGPGGEVTVGLAGDPATNGVCLWVHDNGIGLPPGLVWQQAGTLGLRLVRMLASQLRGTVVTRSGPGTEFRVTFVPPNGIHP